MIGHIILILIVGFFFFELCRYAKDSQQAKLEGWSKYDSLNTYPTRSLSEVEMTIEIPQINMVVDNSQTNNESPSAKEPSPT